MSHDYQDFLSKAQMGAYLEAYACRFGLLGHCRFETHAERVRPAPDGGWTVALEGGEGLHADTEPNARGLFVNGLGQARTGGGPLFQAAGYAIARMAAFEASSPVPLADAIDRTPQIRCARRCLGYLSMATADTRSYSLARRQRALRQLTRILDRIDAPDAPSRRARAEGTGLSATGLDAAAGGAAPQAVLA